jgi:hypothetical protein
MTLNMKAALGELAEARRPCDDLAHSIRSDFVAAEREKFTSDVLNFAHAQTKPHQLGAERHQATAHQISETAAMVLSATASSMPAFTASRPISSSILPRPQPVTCRILAYRIYLDLLRYELQAMTAFESAFVFDRVTSVAAMQEQLRNSLANCRGPDGSLQLSAREST